MITFAARRKAGQARQTRWLLAIAETKRESSSAAIPIVNAEHSPMNTALNCKLFEDRGDLIAVTRRPSGNRAGSSRILDRAALSASAFAGVVPALTERPADAAGRRQRQA